MADGHGGYRAPSHPNQVSGPGQYSKRTDGGAAQVLSAAPGQDYGQMKAQLDAQRQAPMGAQTPMPPPAAVSPAGQGGVPSAPPYNGTPFNAPSQRPDEPVTSGAAIGPGPGPEALTQPTATMGPATGAMTRMLSQLAPTDGSGVIAALLTRAQSLGV